MNPFIDIVLPCYNPNKNWKEELFNFYNFIKDKYSVNFIVVNDGSTENETIQRLHEPYKNLPEIKIISYAINKGKGFALRKGMEYTKSDHIIYTDIDFPFTHQSMLNLINVLVTGKQDIVVGFRNDSYYEKKMSLFRKLLSKTFRFFVKEILKMPVTDTQCGLKGFNKKGKEKFLTTTINRYLFDFEFIYAACKDIKITIQPVEVQLKENVIFSKMKLKILFQELLNLFRVLVFRKIS